MFKLINKVTPRSYAGILLLGSLYITLVFNSPFIYKTCQAFIPTGHWDWLFYLSVPVLLFLLTTLALSWLSLIGFIKPVMIVSLIISSVIFYASVNYGVLMDKEMMRNIVETNTGETLSYLTTSGIAYLFFLGILPSILVMRSKLKRSFLVNLKSFAVINAICLIGVAVILSHLYKDYASVGRNHRELRHYITPFAFYNQTYKLVKDSYLSPPLPFRVMDKNPVATNTAEKSVTVFIVGETARAQNFSLGGYQKHTNPFTEKMGVKYFSRVTSCGTATAISIPCMFSRFSRAKYDPRQATSQDNVLDIIHRSGADVLWIDNDGSCKGVCARVETIAIDTDSDSDLCDGRTCYDQVLINQLQKKLQHLDKQNTVIVLHMIGSHGPTYYRRYPQEKRVFTPDCPRSDIQNCSEEALKNTYDNTIYYTDFILSEVIANLKTVDADNISMLYVSDHGESLGESGLYLHGFPYLLAPEEQIHVPLIYWSNKLNNPTYSACIDNQLAAEISHDNIFDTLLDLTQVSTSIYSRELDFLSTCSTLSLSSGGDATSSAKEV